MERTITFGKKLAVAFSVLLLLALIQSGCLLMVAGKLGVLLDRAVNVSAHNLDRAIAMQVGIQDLAMVAKETQTSYVIASLEGGTAVQSCGSCHALASGGGEEQRFEAVAAKVGVILGELDPLVVDAGERQVLGSVRMGLTECADLYRQYLVHARRKEFTQAHDILKDKMLPAMEGLSKSSADLAARQRLALDVFAATSQSKVIASRWMALALSVVGLLAVLAILAMVRRSFSGLRGIAARLEQESEHVARASRQVAGSSESRAKGASQQAATLAQTAAAGREIQNAAQRNLESAGSAAEATGQVVRSVAEANVLVEEMSSAMQEMSHASERISRIIKTIDEIAFQTNILALNASVEAARSGESGMGFAVVAGEVRSLALRCAEAARDTSTLIDGSIGKARESTGKLDRVAAAVRSINAHTGQVKTLADKVRSGSQEQTGGIGQIAGAIQQIEEVTRQSAAGAEQDAEAGRDLSRRSDALRTLVEDLTALVGRSADSAGVGLR